MGSIINVSGVSLSYGVTEILHDITFNVNSGAKVGIIGVNGAGKTSLFNIIMNRCEYTGHVFIPKGTKIGFLQQQCDESFAGKTVYEYIYDSLLEEYKTKASGVLAKLSFPLDMQNMSADLLSGGQKTRLALASVLLSDNDVILLDEPTNHLDIETIKWLEGVVSSSKKTFLIISHDRYFLDRTTTHTLEIENGRATMLDGGYSVFREKRDKLLKDMQKSYMLQQREIKRLEAFIENQRKWNRERNIIAAESRQKAIDRMVKVDKPLASPSKIKFKIASAPKGGTDVLSVRGVSKSFDHKKILNNISFELKKKQRLFIVGANGAGKSTLLKILTGRLEADDGVYEFGYNQKIGYYDQEQQLLDDSNTVIGELWDCYEGLTQTQVRSALASFNFIGDDVFKNVAVLSGGERARLSICKLILTGVSLLILDEPTNHLDISSKETLENALLEYDGTLLTVSHDRYFIKTLATRIYEISPTDGFVDFNGNYEAYEASRKTIAEKRDKAETDKNNDYLERKREKSERQRAEKRAEYVKKRIVELERQAEEVKCKIEGEYSTDFEMLETLYGEQEKIDAELLELYGEE